MVGVVVEKKDRLVEKGTSGKVTLISTDKGEEAAAGKGGLVGFGETAGTSPKPCLLLVT